MGVAQDAVDAGAGVLAGRYDALETELVADHSATDVKAEADEAAEAAIVPVLREAFPGHAVYAEEAGYLAPAEPPAADEPGYRWIVDPLDGTNNFAAGLPTFASAVALEELPEDDPLDDLDRPAVAGTPVVAAAALPVTAERYAATRDGGFRYDGAGVTASSERALSAATVATVIGRDVLVDDALAERTARQFDAIEDACKRRMDTWAPTVHWGLLGRGLLDAVVAVHPDREEQVLGELFAREAEAAIDEDGGRFVAAASEPLLDELLAVLPEAPP